LRPNLSALTAVSDFLRASEEKSSKRALQARHGAQRQFGEVGALSCAHLRARRFRFPPLQRSPSHGQFDITPGQQRDRAPLPTPAVPDGGLPDSHPFENRQHTLSEPFDFFRVPKRERQGDAAALLVVVELLESLGDLLR
jgi:hypothetical protein